MNLEIINKWLENEFGVSYTRLEELHDFVVEQDLKHQDEKDKQINQLQSNWNSLRELIEKEKTRLATECSHTYEDSLGKTKYVNESIFNELNKVLDKMNELEGGDNDERNK